jgi:uroporphyrinogen decarboxylase
MTSRERVLTSFRHHTPDRVPLDYVAVPELDQLLLRELGLPNRAALLDRLRVDFRHLDKWGTMLPRYVGPELRTTPDGITEDLWGCRLKRLEYRPGCFYDEYVDFPLASATSVRDVERHRWPSPDWYDFTPVTEFCRRDHSHCLVGGRGATLDSVGFFRGIEQAMLDLYDYPAVVEAIVEKIFEFQYEYNVRLLRAAEGRLDILFFSEDMGAQDGLLVSPEMLRKYVFPKFAAYTRLAHANGALAMLHSDGAIRAIIPELIDLGIDIIDPVQTTCPGMDETELKREFGDRLCFHGLLDSQAFLPRASPAEVVAEARRLERTVGRNGGLALHANCGFQIDVPVANVLALYDGMAGA